ncbi:MAG: TonB-dependent SusC/RagA subfamily outer membrane receptor, partial [Paraglaciecola sp.]
MKKVIRTRVKYSFPIKLDLKMRITTLLLLVSLFQLHANDSYAQKTKVSLNYTNVSLETVFDKIEAITDFKFIYKDKEIDYNQKVSILVKKERLSKVLKKLLTDSRISYLVNGKQIILKPLQISIDTKVEKINEVAQKISITGIVVDKSGEPLPGASIIEKGTTNGTETDFNGNFSIAIKNKEAILVVQYLGYTKKEVTVKDKTNLKIVLIEDASSLDEIVVIGYGSLSRSKVLGAVSSVSAEDISQLPVSSLDDAIAGRVAGVQIVSNGAPGAGSTINIRGIGTLTAGGSPLIVVDGYPLTEGSDINAVNPNDIESMNILKDAASTAIYGSRGANGVIIISTKKAKTDKVTFNFNTFSGFQEVLNEPKFMNAYQFAEVIKEARDWGYVSADPSNRNATDSNATRLSQGAVSR